jgi:putative ABC transport system ATP-binding protein
MGNMISSAIAKTPLERDRLQQLTPLFQGDWQQSHKMPFNQPKTSPPVLSARQLRKVYGSGEAQTEALHNVDLKLQSGEFLAIMGPSGSGKSTLLHLLGGVDTPTSGVVQLEGVAFSELNDEQRSLIRRRRIGFVFQRINLLPTLSAQENVALPLLLDQHPRGSAMQRALAALELVKMAHRKGHLPNELSGGERQRVAIARALAIEPAMILADEPTGALDSVMGREIMKLLRSVMNRERSMVIVTHDPQVAAEADRCLVVRDGTIQTDSSASPAIAALSLREVL